MVIASKKVCGDRNISRSQEFNDLRKVAWDCVQVIADELDQNSPVQHIIKPHIIYTIRFPPSVRDLQNRFGLCNIPQMFTIDEEYEIHEEIFKLLIVGFLATKNFFNEVGLDTILERTDFIIFYPFRYMNRAHGSMSGGNYVSVKLGNGAVYNILYINTDSITKHTVKSIIHEKGHAIWECNVASKFDIRPNGNQTFPFFDEGCMSLLGMYTNFAMDIFEKSQSLPSLLKFLESNISEAKIYLSPYGSGFFRTVDNQDRFIFRKTNLTGNKFFNSMPNVWPEFISYLANDVNFRAEQKSNPGHSATLFNKLRDIEYFYLVATALILEIAYSNRYNLNVLSQILWDAEEAYRNSLEDEDVPVHEIITKVLPGNLSFNLLVINAIQRLQSASVENYRNLGIVPPDFGKKNSIEENFALLAKEYAIQAEELVDIFNNKYDEDTFFNRPIGIGSSNRLILTFEEMQMLINSM